MTLLGSFHFQTGTGARHLPWPTATPFFSFVLFNYGFLPAVFLNFRVFASWCAISVTLALHAMRHGLPLQFQ